ncbi:calcium-binding protein [Pleurocapsa sp. PCC 7319]|uniref:calcium-binding protein n=1 Tax=Pleurocapsa sp. PCC 7319 TaxID=118161 RepID=UPI000346D11D|nr:hypothetical protein [Pleurocapsa sp. PCC 7319]
MVTSISSLTPGDDNIQTISGTVVSVREDEFILRDETGEILVDAYDWLKQPESLDAELDLAIGEPLLVVGELDDDDFDSLKIIASDRSVVFEEQVLEEATLLGSQNNQFVQETNDPVIVNGGAGNDSLTGAQGSDFLIGGTGNDLLTGGAGYDTFIVGQGADTIADFSSSDIIVDLGDSFDDIEAILGSSGAATQVNQDTVIDLGDGNSVTLVQFDVENLTAANFDLGDF